MTLHRLPAAIIGEGNEDEGEEEGDMAEVEEAKRRKVARLYTRANLLLSRQRVLLLRSHRRTYHSTQCPNLTPASVEPPPANPHPEKSNQSRTSSYKNPR